MGRSQLKLGIFQNFITVLRSTLLIEALLSLKTVSLPAQAGIPWIPSNRAQKQTLIKTKKPDQ